MSAFFPKIMKKILFIPVGGTICTALTEKGTLDVNKGAGAVIIENFKKSGSPFVGETEFIAAENLMILSENMTVEKWNMMLDTYRSFGEDFDGVIFAHGTDTLAFSAALFSLMPKELPVFFVSSNARLDSERANGNENFRCAVECICNGIAPGVYVPYKNISSGKMLLHFGSRIKQCPCYSEDFESEGAFDLTEGVKALPESMPEETALPKNLWEKLRLMDKVLVLWPYVGLNYEAVDYSRFSAVLHGTYHSGTACTGEGKNSILRMLELCRGKADVYLSPSKAEGEVYDTVRIIAENGDIEFLYGDTFELTYAKLLVAYSLFDNKEDIIKFVKG